MKALFLFSKSFLFFLAALAAWPQAASCQEEDRTLSPYFFVRNDNHGPDQLPLKSVAADVSISGVIADVTLKQVYRNNGRQTLEAIYVFPASTRAAVYSMKMTIGDRTIQARIKKRDEARKDYEDARAQGKSASLLEQQRPNVFQMNVGNIRPGDVISVEMKYTEILVPSDGVYTFVYPAVVGPRYSNRPEAASPASGKWSKNPYLKEGSAPTYDFDVKVRLSSGVPIQEITCPSHRANIGYKGRTTAEISLDKSERHGGNRDYIVHYGLQGGRIESGLLLTKGDKENFFLLMMQPPKAVRKTDITPREYIFIVDVSGSMHGFPLDISKTLLKDLIGRLRPSDTFNVLLFSGGSAVLSEHSLSATKRNIENALAFIGSRQGGGGTELLPALKRALSLPKAEGCSRTVVIATDGYVTVEEEAFDLIRSNLGNANMFAFGIGTAVNRHLIEGMARAGMGEPFVITKPEEAAAKAEAFRRLIESPVLTDIKISYQGLDVYDVEPRTVPDVLAGRPVIIFGKWKGRPEGLITLNGRSGDSRYRETIAVEKAGQNANASALRYLWARHRIAMLADYNMLRNDDKRVREVTELGLAYNLLTAYTSFVAVDSVVRGGSESTTVKQPLPLPQGVSNYAVGETRAFPMAAMPARAANMPRTEGLMQEKASQPEAKAKDEAVHIVFRDIRVTGGLTEEAVVRTLKSVEKEVRQSFASESGASITVKITVGSDGKVSKLRVKSENPKKKGLSARILKVLEKLVFPPEPGGKKTTIIVTITR